MKSTITSQDMQLVLALLGKRGVSMTQNAFGREIGVRDATVNRWANGIVPVPLYVEKWLKATHPRIYRKIKRSKGEKPSAPRAAKLYNKCGKVD